MSSTQDRPPFWHGSEKYWYEALEAGATRGLKTTVVVRDSPEMRQRSVALIAAGIDVEFDTLPVAGLPGAAVRHARHRFARGPIAPVLDRWARCLSRGDVGLVWFNLASFSMIRAVEAHAAACVRRGIPYWLVVQHAGEDWFPPDEHERARYYATAAGARRIVFVSDLNHAAAERGLGAAFPNAWRSRNTVPRSFFDRAMLVPPPAVTGTARLLNLARFDPQYKGQHRLLEALRGLTTSQAPWQLVLQGAGPLDRVVRHAIERSGLHDRVRMRPAQQDILAALAECDLFVMPSLSEGTPFALLEAMAAGRPSVVTPVGGMPELIEDGRTGWLAASTSPRDISEALERAFAARERWPEIGAAARQAIQAQYLLEAESARLRAALTSDVR